MPIPVNLAVEDELSETVLRALLRQTNREFSIGFCFKKQGFGYLKNKIRGFNNAAKGTPFIILTDLDSTVCASALINAWLPEPKHPNLIFRVAVREVESWLLAHREAFAKFLAIPLNKIPTHPDTIVNPKKCLIDLARQSQKTGVKEDIVPPTGSMREQGPDYNGRLGDFIQNYWKASRGRTRSPSLDRAMQHLSRFRPVYLKTR